MLSYIQVISQPFTSLNAYVQVALSYISRLSELLVTKVLSEDWSESHQGGL